MTSWSARYDLFWWSRECQSLPTACLWLHCRCQLFSFSLRNMVFPWAHKRSSNKNECRRCLCSPSTWNSTACGSEWPLRALASNPLQNSRLAWTSLCPTNRVAYACYSRRRTPDSCQLIDRSGCIQSLPYHQSWQRSSQTPRLCISFSIYNYLGSWQGRSTRNSSHISRY